MGNWRVEAAVGSGRAEGCLIVIDPNVNPDDLAECCAAMCDPELIRVHIVFDKRATPLHVQACLKIIKDVMPNLQYIVKHAEPRIIKRMGFLWRRMQVFCERRKTREKVS